MAIRGGMFKTTIIHTLHRELEFKRGSTLYMIIIRGIAGIKLKQ